LTVHLGVELELEIGVRGGNDVRRPGIRGGAQHTDASLECVRSIVHTRENMRMYVDQKLNEHLFVLRGGYHARTFGTLK
jgi:hypothetical protein